VAADLPEESTPDEHPPEARERARDDDSLDEMPEFEELTPELMEDECRRGDTMLRGALVLLAVLLSWTTITESRLLVDIRSGEYMLSHGILPPHGDVFSGSAAGRTWVNPGWLSDLLMGGLHRVLGFPSLTLLCVATVCVAFLLLVRIGIPGLSTWWGSCCGLLVVVALFPMYQPGASTFTILGLAILLYCLASESQLPANAEVYGSLNRFSWSLPYVPLLFLIWANVDPRAWAGLCLLLCFLVGDSLSRLLSGHRQSRRDWGVFLVTVMVVCVLTPWPVQTLLYPLHFWRDLRAVQTYSIVSDLFPVGMIHGYLDRTFWNQLNLFHLSALVLWGVSLITLLLNFRRLHLSWLLVWVAANLPGLVSEEWLCYAAIVNAVIATLNGQEWYRSRFSLEYAIDRWSIFWGRGGRAVVVVSFLWIAYLAINGALMGPQGRRLGLGLDPRWRARIQSLEQNVVQHTYSDRVFPTLPAQGDLLIWLGKKPFIDSRLDLYLNGKENLFETHQAIRASLFAPSTKKNPADQILWKEKLRDFQMSDVLVRLWGPVPPYEPFLKMMANPDWSMTGLGAAGANFTRIDLPEESLIQHVRKYSATHFAEMAFRPKPVPKFPELQGVWPLPVSRYDKWLVQKLQVSSNVAELAAHYDNLLSAMQEQMPLDRACGLAMLAVRGGREALAQNPNDPLAYRVLARAYHFLAQGEQQVSRSSGVALNSGTYDIQSLAMIHAAAIASGGNPIDLQLLLETVMARQQIDLSLKTLTRLREQLKTLPAGAISSQRQEEFTRLSEDLSKRVDDVQARIEAARANNAQRPQLVSVALQGHCPGLALSILEEDLTELERAPDLKLLHGTLLMQTGAFDLALQTLESMEAPVMAAAKDPRMQPLVAEWRNQTANANLGTGDLERALNLWQENDQSSIRAAVQALLQMPFASLGVPIQYELWPAFTARLAANAAIEIPEQVGQLQLQAARAELELGQLDKAKSRLQLLLKEYPETSWRFVAAFYLQELTGKKVDVAPLKLSTPVEDEKSAEKMDPEKNLASPSDKKTNSSDQSSKNKKPAGSGKPQDSSEKKPAEKNSSEAKLSTDDKTPPP